VGSFGHAYLFFENLLFICDIPLKNNKYTDFVIGISWKIPGDFPLTFLFPASYWCFRPGNVAFIQNSLCVNTKVDLLMSLLVFACDLKT